MLSFFFYSVVVGLSVGHYIFLLFFQSKYKAIFNDIGNDSETTQKNITFQNYIVSPNKRLELIPGPLTMKENFVPQKISKSTNKTKITQCKCLCTSSFYMYIYTIILKFIGIPTYNKFRNTN